MLVRPLVGCMSPCEDDLSVIIRYYCRNGRVCKKYLKVQENGKWETGKMGIGKMGIGKLGKLELGKWRMELESWIMEIGSWMMEIGI